MKFLTQKGKIEEGIPLTDDQVQQRSNLITYFHETACQNGYHGIYSEKKCETLANDFVTGAIDKAANLQPEPEPQPAAPEPVAVAVEKDELFF